MSHFRREGKLSALMIATGLTGSASGTRIVESASEFCDDVSREVTVRDADAVAAEVLWPAVVGTRSG